MLQKSKKEMDLVVNFLREGQYLDPETSILKKDNRENFFDNFHEEQTVYHLFNKWDHHELKCYMLIPKTLDKTRKIPFHVLFHGGGLVSTENHRSIAVSNDENRQPGAETMSTGSLTTSAT